MKRLITVLAFALAMTTLLAAGCSQAAPSSPAPAAAPTKAAEPAKAAEPTKAPAAAPTAAAPAAAPTAAAAPKVNFPAGKPVTFIVPYAPGGGTDANARMVASGMEKVLGVPVQVVNKAGAGSQVGVTELVQAKPDGYTVCATSQPGTTLLYLDSERKAIFDRKSFMPVATYGSDPQFLAVAKASPYKTTADLVAAMKAKPETVKFATSGMFGAEHVASVQFGLAAGAKPAIVHFDGSASAMTALLGGHIDVYVGNMPTFASAFKSGDVRFLAVMDSTESKLAPGITTLASQGYNVNSVIGRLMSVPAGTPQGIVDILANSIQKAVADADYQKKAGEMFLTPKYLGPAETAKNWDEEEAGLKPVVVEITKDRK